MECHLCDLSGACSQNVRGLDAFDHRRRIIQVVLAQKARDEAIDHLVDVMNDIYSFVHEAEALRDIQSDKQIVVVMTQQTIDCAYFIRDYAINKNFCMSIFIYDALKAYIVNDGRETNCQ